MQPDSLIWETARPRTHKAKIVKESLRNLRSSLPSFKRLDVVRSRDTVNSAVALVKTSGVKPTGMLRLVHSLMSTCSYPTDMVLIARRLGPVVK